MDNLNLYIMDIVHHVQFCTSWIILILIVFFQVLSILIVCFQVYIMDNLNFNRLLSIYIYNIYIFITELSMVVSL